MILSLTRTIMQSKTLGQFLETINPKSAGLLNVAGGGGGGYNVPAPSRSPQNTVKKSKQVPMYQVVPSES